MKEKENRLGWMMFDGKRLMDDGKKNYKRNRL